MTQRSHCHGLTSISGQELKSCCKSLQTEATEINSMPADPQEGDGATCVAECESSGSEARLAGVDIYQLGHHREVNSLLSFLICKMGIVYP